MYQTKLDEDDVSAKELWTELNKTYVLSNSQAIFNIVSKLDSLELHDDENSDTHVAMFSSFIEELASHDHVLSDQEKLTKILRSLSDYLESIYVACYYCRNSFEEVSSAVAESIVNRKKKILWTSGSSAANGAIEGKIPVGNRHGRGNFQPARGRGVLGTA